MESTYKIYATLFSEINKGEVWISEDFKTRLIKITNKTNGKSVVVANRVIEGNYIKYYNAQPHTNKIKNGDSVLIIDDYYRKKIGDIKTKTDEKLSINAIKWYHFYSKLRYVLCHANDSVKIGSWLALISILISTIGLLYSFYTSHSAEVSCPHQGCFGK